MIRLVCIAEMQEAIDLDDAQRMFDAWRERHRKCNRAQAHNPVVLYRATERDADTAMYMPDPDKS